MNSYGTFGRQLRLQRLHKHTDERLFIVPMDHSVTTGPISGGGGLSALVRQISANGADAVVLHKGTARQVDHRWFAGTSLIVHLSASTVCAADPDAKYLVASVEESVRLGADAVSVHVNLGSRDERQQISDLALVADQSDRWGVPLLAMMYPRGPKIDDPGNPELIAHAATVAADLGADIVKLPPPNSVSDLADVVDACPIPVVVAGGAPRGDLDQLVSYVDGVMMTGASGVAVGRNIFQAPDATAATRRVAESVHRVAEAIPPARMASLQTNIG
ncbi:2-amino-4,5-dihydroxy-6-one-heptanoic acid-7-phosphate synthase [Actinophytocola sp. S1-96]|uniref:2-amino-4,5-dihydroxy-6-one-heptanoic acid-7-phosphate synthase n=2 Tax=Actinophytocola gossypii TaxID=2812003 RepID=A0ABT2J2G4_9PSEU|nr:2-amino-4,5-dihydroxy-6-one-heptanoic acid-7-phosphate synthase [Actinophytocola gossypii]